MHMLEPNIRSGIFEIEILDKSSFYRAICRASHLVSIDAIYRAIMSLIQPLVVYQTQLRSI